MSAWNIEEQGDLGFLEEVVALVSEGVFEVVVEGVEHWTRSSHGISVPGNDQKKQGILLV